MATLKPFRILRPRPDEAGKICSLPYDVMNTEEARQMAEGNPLSFLRVTRAEIEMDEGVDPYSREVYQHGADNLRRMIDEGHLQRAEKGEYMLYRLTMGDHSQLGLVAAASCPEYDKGIVKKHENTKPDKEDDRTRHIDILNAQTGAVFLTYRAEPEIDALFDSLTKRDPDIDFTAEDGIRHTAWIISDHDDAAEIAGKFAKVDALYVADGHHRSAAASRVARERTAANKNHSGTEGYNYFLSVTFPHDQVKILGYNRVVKDLQGLSEEEFLEKIAAVADISDGMQKEPAEKGELTIYLGGRWRTLRWKPDAARRGSTVARLDVSLLQDLVLSPVLHIGDPRTDKRIDFVGGIRGPRELERIVDSGKYAVAFGMYPTALEDLMDIADEGGLMPPKSTWFEPKLRDAMAVHLLDE